jgi:FMN phosphatase YigB (HAD superfamily)
MDAVVIDIDDTLIDTERRRHATWCKVLGREIPLQATETSGSREILRRYAFSDKRTWEKFWLLALCVEEGGADARACDFDSGGEFQRLYT